jgi:hypothetical protein
MRLPQLSRSDRGADGISVPRPIERLSCDKGDPLGLRIANLGAVIPETERRPDLAAFLLPATYRPTDEFRNADDQEADLFFIAIHGAGKTENARFPTLRREWEQDRSSKRELFEPFLQNAELLRTFAETPEAYYASLAHECAHWTRHPSRLDAMTAMPPKNS